MNCLQFRRATLADPRRLEHWATRHAEECPACRAFYAQELELENRLEEALRVDVPQRLTERALARHARPPLSRRWLALAAGLLMSGTAGFFLGAQRQDPVALAGIDFVVFDEAQTLFDPKPTDWKALVRTAAGMGVRIPDGNSDIRFVCVYAFAAGEALHLLARTPAGKVTVLLLPGRPAAARASAAARGLQALVLPAARGSVVIVGASSDSVARTERLLGPV
ncbi:MAG: DUF3379 family protein [Betaproteobacteria bacterium]